MNIPHGTAAGYFQHHCHCLDCYNAHITWQNKRITEGPHGTNTLYGYGCRCGPCRQAATDYRAKRAGTYNAHRARRRQLLRAAVIAYYADTWPPRCKCCGTTDQLCIDHTYGDGAEHRDMISPYQECGWHFYAWLIQAMLPPGYGVYCVACNRSKAAGSRCRLNHEERQAA